MLFIIRFVLFWIWSCSVNEIKSLSTHPSTSPSPSPSLSYNSLTYNRRATDALGNRCRNNSTLHISHSTRIWYRLCFICAWPNGNPIWERIYYIHSKSNSEFFGVRCIICRGTASTHTHTHAKPYHYHIHHHLRVMVYC